MKKILFILALSVLLTSISFSTMETTKSNSVSIVQDSDDYPIQTFSNRVLPGA